MTFCARGRFCVVLFWLHEFEDALDSKQRFRTRRTAGHDLPQSLERSEHLLQREFVELDLRLPVHPPHVQVDCEAASRNALAHSVANTRLQTLKAWWHAQPYIEAAAVHRTQLPSASSSCPSPRPPGQNLSCF